MHTKIHRNTHRETQRQDPPPIYIYIYIRGAYDKFPDFFGMGTFIDSTHMKL